MELHKHEVMMMELQYSATSISQFLNIRLCAMHSECHLVETPGSSG